MATIKDIAREAGVSVATVSRALANPAVVRGETRRRVDAAIRTLNYTPNAMASSLRRKRSDVFVVMVPDIHNPFYSGIVQGIESVAHENGLRILLGETQDEQARLDSYAEMLRTKQADGLIQIGTLTPSGWELPENAGRIVLACEYYEGLPLPSVRIDNEQAAREAVSYLIALGHRRIATITGPMESRLGRDRLAGFKAAMADADLQIDDRFLSIGAFDLDSGKRGMQSLLSLRDRPTAVFCANDEMAMGALRALYEAGMRVPDDCSIMGFDDIRFADYAIPPLTTIAQPNVAIGEAAMNLMLECLAGEGVIREVVLPHQLVVRGSTATIRRHPD